MLKIESVLNNHFEVSMRCSFRQKIPFQNKYQTEEQKTRKRGKKIKRKRKRERVKEKNLKKKEKKTEDVIDIDIQIVGQNCANAQAGQYGQVCQAMARHSSGCWRLHYTCSSQKQKVGLV